MNIVLRERDKDTSKILSLKKLKTGKDPNNQIGKLILTGIKHENSNNNRHTA